MKTGACNGTGETRPDDQLALEKPAPSSPPDLSQPEIEDDDQCVTVVTHLFILKVLQVLNGVAEVS